MLNKVEDMVLEITIRRHENGRGILTAVIRNFFTDMSETDYELTGGAVEYVVEGASQEQLEESAWECVNGLFLTNQSLFQNTIQKDSRTSVHLDAAADLLGKLAAGKQEIQTVIKYE